MKGKSSKKLTHEFVISEIEKMHPGAKVLSIYKNAISELTIICENKHNYKMSWNKIRIGRWCKSCWFDRVVTTTTQDVINFLNKNHPGAKLLDKYTNCGQTMKIICENGHNYKASWNNISLGKWCRKCKNLYKKPSKEDINKLCEKYNVKLAKEYDDGPNLNLICSCGKEFETPYIIKNKSLLTCKECSHQRYMTLENLKLFIAENHKDSICLAKEYISSETKFDCVCKRGHKFSTCGSYIRKGNWCPNCCKTKKKTLEFVKNYVRENFNGECLSDIYTNKRTPMKFKCHKGHTWFGKFENINQGCWCPECSSGFGERISRYILSEMFESNFKKVKLDCFINEKTGAKFELDGYCSELNIAMEYQGRYHKEIVKSYKMTEKDLEKRKEYDKIKRRKCKENNIFLIEIPEFNKQFRPKHLPGFIDNIMKTNELNINYKTDINIAGFYV